MYNFMDTETTGFPSKDLPADHPNQAQICQLGSMVMNDSRRVVAEFNVLIKPNGWSIPSHVSAIHGITTQMCEDYGVPLRDAMLIYDAHIRMSQKVVIHNVQFDNRMICMAYEQLGLPAAGFIKKDKFCTMEATTEICKLPKARGTGYKWPKLTEAYFHFFKVELQCAHDAMADVRGCAAVYWEVTNPQSTLRQVSGAPDAGVTITNAGL